MSDPTPALAPEWARKMADTCTGMTYDFIALLLASVRDAALREAARVVYRASNKSGDIASWYLDDVGDYILKLVGTAPKQTEKEAPRG